MTNKFDGRVTSEDWIDFYVNEPMLGSEKLLAFGDLPSSASENVESSNQRQDVEIPSRTASASASQRVTSSDAWFESYFANTNERTAIESAQRISSSDFVNEFVLGDGVGLQKIPPMPPLTSSPTPVRTTEPPMTIEESSVNSKDAASHTSAVVLEPGENDVVLGRGGKGNNHIGNKRYRAMTAELRAEYATLDKASKTEVSHRLVDMVHAAGGRFLQKDSATNLWVEVDKKRARRKASQALREEKRSERCRRKGN